MYFIALLDGNSKYCPLAPLTLDTHTFSLYQFWTSPLKANFPSGVNRWFWALALRSHFCLRFEEVALRFCFCSRSKRFCLRFSEFEVQIEAVSFFITMVFEGTDDHVKAIVSKPGVVHALLSFFSTNLLVLKLIDVATIAIERLWWTVGADLDKNDIQLLEILRPRTKWNNSTGTYATMVLLKYCNLLPRYIYTGDHAVFVLVPCNSVDRLLICIRHVLPSTICAYIPQSSSVYQRHISWTWMGGILREELARLQTLEAFIPPPPPCNQSQSQLHNFFGSYYFHGVGRY